MLLIATTNAGKLREFQAMLGDLPLRLVSLAAFPGAPEVPEDGATYADNAAVKALALARWSGGATLADDSGLEVDALGGAPGVHSARYAGASQESAANITQLLRALAGVSSAQRTARFRCVIVVACPDGAQLSAAGTCEGVITTAPRGSDGFGYDPIFFHPPSGCTFGELPAAVKNRLSHRAGACAALRPQLLSFLAAHVARRGDAAR